MAKWVCLWTYLLVVNNGNSMSQVRIFDNPYQHIWGFLRLRRYTGPCSSHIDHKFDCVGFMRKNAILESGRVVELNGKRGVIKIFKVYVSVFTTHY